MLAVTEKSDGAPTKPFVMTGVLNSGYLIEIVRTCTYGDGTIVAQRTILEEKLLGFQMRSRSERALKERPDRSSVVRCSFVVVGWLRKV